jgi:BirA family transcriptional regulator, biotin operon repressor / biotin---[acetyl-CoA-carboxylase] ligase
VINWRVRQVAETGSTNADLVALAQDGEPEGAVLVADHQTSGRGRHGRSWQAPPGTGLAVSLLLRPTTVPTHRWTWLPLFTGVAVVEGLRVYPAAEAVLKWPNDVLLGSRKLAGILVERVDSVAGPAAVVGVGLNVSAAPDGAVSLVAAGFPDVSRDDVLAALLEVVGARYDQWNYADADPEPWLRPAYRALCGTLGRQVRADLPGRGPVVGQAIEVDSDGRLVVRTDVADVAIGAGDVEYVRPL